MRQSTLIVTLAALILLGCQSVHTPSGNSIPVALWHSVVCADAQDQREAPEPRDKVARALKEAGLHATVDDKGVSVADDESRRAREVLLTDKRLAKTQILVFLAIPAGTGRKTAAGFEVPAVAPDEPMRFRSTDEAK